MDDDVIVRFEHVKQARMCSKGTRAFFISHNLDFQSFLKHGIRASELEKLNDAMANQAIEVARHGRKQ